VRRLTVFLTFCYYIRLFMHHSSTNLIFLASTIDLITSLYNRPRTGCSRYIWGGFKLLLINLWRSNQLYLALVLFCTCIGNRHDVDWWYVSRPLFMVVIRQRYSLVVSSVNAHHEKHSNQLYRSSIYFKNGLGYFNWPYIDNLLTAGTEGSCSYVSVWCRSDK